MQARQIQIALKTDPFVPLKLVKNDGTSIDIPFRHVAVPVRHGLLVFKGVKNERSHSAKDYELIAFDRITRIEPKRKQRYPRKTH